MVCERISYTNFRNISSAQLEFSPKTNLLFGHNAEGKTNALEGIGLFSSGRSFRGAKDKDLIRFGEQFAVLNLRFRDRNRTHELEIRYAADGRKILRKNGVVIRRLSEFVGNFRAVVFCPQHLSLVREGPALRRAFLDSALSPLSPAYMRALQRYAAVLAQRNALLKNYRTTPSVFHQTADIWSGELAELSEKIARNREEYTRRLDGVVREIFSDMTGGSEIPAMTYPTARSRDEYYRQLTENTEAELKMGTTLYGVHRDDLSISLNGRSAKQFASQGQQRSLALAMKMAESEISRRLTGEYPVLLLDDILSELDEGRQRYVLEGIGHMQAIITSCDPNAQQHPGNSADGRAWLVEDGSYTPQSGGSV